MLPGYAVFSAWMLQICEAYNANRYPFPEDPARQRQMNAEVTARLRELHTTIEAGEPFYMPRPAQPYSLIACAAHLLHVGQFLPRSTPHDGRRVYGCDTAVCSCQSVQTHVRRCRV